MNPSTIIYGPWVMLLNLLILFPHVQNGENNVYFSFTIIPSPDNGYILSFLVNDGVEKNLPYGIITLYEFQMVDQKPL